MATAWGDTFIREGDEIVLWVGEHHSNICPWQLLAQRTGAVLRFAGLSAEEGLDLPGLLSLIRPGKTKLVAVAHVSNVLGIILPVVEIARAAHAAGALVAVDACQVRARSIDRSRRSRSQ